MKTLQGRVCVCLPQGLIVGQRCTGSLVDARGGGAYASSALTRLHCSLIRWLDACRVTAIPAHARQLVQCPQQVIHTVCAGCAVVQTPYLDEAVLGHVNDQGLATLVLEGVEAGLRQEKRVGGSSDSRLMFLSAQGGLLDSNIRPRALPVVRRGLLDNRDAHASSLCWTVPASCMCSASASNVLPG